MYTRVSGANELQRRVMGKYPDEVIKYIVEGYLKGKSTKVLAIETKTSIHSVRRVVRIYGPPDAKKTDKRILGKIMQAIVKSRGHWIWQKSCNGEGTPQTQHGDTVRGVHRILWEILIGDPGELNIKNTCGMERCVNPAHHALKIV
jgi:hypothetical protein